MASTEEVFVSSYIMKSEILASITMDTKIPVDNLAFIRTDGFEIRYPTLKEDNMNTTQNDTQENTHEQEIAKITELLRDRAIKGEALMQQGDSFNAHAFSEALGVIAKVFPNARTF